MSGWNQILASREFVCDLPGAELERFPYISGYGLALRVSRLLSLDPKDFKSVLGIRGGAYVDLLASTRGPRPSVSLFINKLGLTGSGVEAYWTEEAWSPMQLHKAWNLRDEPVRTCEQCARFGYHSMLFQLPSLDACPWHGCALSAHCRECRVPQAGSFGPDGQLGSCHCGHDVFDADFAATQMWDFPSETAKAWMETYLGWAAAERPFRHLVARPESRPSDWASGFASLAAPPPSLLPAPTCPSVIAHDISLQEVEEPIPGYFWGWALLSGEARPLTYLALPDDVRPALAAATERAVGALPKLTPTPKVFVSTLGFERDQPLATNVANRANCFFAPFGERADGPTWLNVSAMDPCALTVCEQLVHRVAKTLGGLEVTTDRSWQVARSTALDRVRGRASLAYALRALLAKGYEQGLEAILRSHVGQPWSPERPWLEPIVEVRGYGTSLDAVRIAWVPCRRGSVRKAPQENARPGRAGRPKPSIVGRKRTPSARHGKMTGRSKHIRGRRRSSKC